MEENNDVFKCRLCLDKIDENEQMVDLFLDDGATQNEADTFAKFAEKVEICCGVRIRESPEMPSKICFKCFDMTRFWFNFRQMVLNSQVYLESMCSDREIPTEVGNDEQKYINFLLEDLQIAKVGAFQADINDDDFNVEFIGQFDDEGNAVDGDYLSDNDIIQVKNEIYGEDSDSEIEKMLQSITKNNTDDMMVYDEKKLKKGCLKTTTTVSPTKKQASQRDLERRMKRIVRPQSPNTYMCTICGNVYQKKASFKNHMNIHSNIKPHSCEICNKKFRQVSELKNHMRRHTGEKPYQCSFCDRRFIDRSEKHRHERVHTNTRPYKCNVCDKSFAYSTILKNHQKLHSGEKDYHCVVCHKYFSLPHQLKAHLQTLIHKQKEAHFADAGYEVIYE